jgi:ornithine cyclodeaminase/alanine dehydrogenase
MGEIIYLSRKDVESIGLSMKEVLGILDNGFRLKGLGMVEMPPKPGVHPVKDAFIHAMPAYIKEVEAAGVKWVSGYPSNIEKGLPYISGLLILNDPKTGIPIAVMDCAWITAMRTGASVGVSAKYLANKNSKIVGIIGCGVQARTSLKALVEILPNLSSIYCYDLFPNSVKRFIEDMKKEIKIKLDYVVCNNEREMIKDADIVVSAIPIVVKPQPPLDAGMLKKGALAVSLDYDSAWTSDAMKECDKFVSDDINQLLETKAHGVYFSGIPDKIYADLAELSAGLKQGRKNPDERIFSMNMGIAMDDMVVAKALYESAANKKIGVKLTL